MTDLSLHVMGGRERYGVKGPQAARWLTSRGVEVPAVPTTWTRLVGGAPGVAALSADGPAVAGGVAPGAAPADDAIVARLGASEFFLEDRAGGTPLRHLGLRADALPPGVYPVLREDAALSLQGAAAEDVLLQVCNVNFSALELTTRPVIMTLMTGIAVLVVPQVAGTARRYRIWCDPTFGPYLEETLGGIVIECGGSHRSEAT